MHAELRDHVQDCRCRVIITIDDSQRRGKSIATKAIIDTALKECPFAEHVLMLQRTGRRRRKCPTTALRRLSSSFTYVIGWIIGHSYIYGPFLNSITTTVFERTPVYPHHSRYWKTVQKYELIHFCSTPTAIRLLRRLGAHHVEKWDLSSLRVLEKPINSEVELV
jgi:acyl-coenzyme A synthetase/AMP-(fatty) acid ligase